MCCTLYLPSCRCIPLLFFATCALPQDLCCIMQHVNIDFIKQPIIWKTLVHVMTSASADRWNLSASPLLTGCMHLQSSVAG